MIYFQDSKAGNLNQYGSPTINRPRHVVAPEVDFRAQRQPQLRSVSPNFLFVVGPVHGFAISNSGQV
ncbi:hypothetical protein MES5069_1320020 [Mesorhizobium escarrei]|uniref:Uncharacterized protein n=1 Tax=Mesorhizobium escarrei TaxID=666018 RepID=A0ABM9DK54_9HYPH|nr:hypothetical protein MES5069_1320020 [Mesorhizobium escarrei]